MTMSGSGLAMSSTKSHSPPRRDVVDETARELADVVHQLR